MGLDRFQNIRTRLHAFDRGPPLPLDRYDDVLPRPNEFVFKWNLWTHHEDPARSPVPAPFSGLGSGRVYRPTTPPAMSMMEPPATTHRNGRWQIFCPFRGSATGCDFAAASGLALQAHIQREHLSRNDKTALVNGVAYRPEHWWRVGGITDLSGRREAIMALSRRPIPYRQRLLARRL